MTAESPPTLDRELFANRIGELFAIDLELPTGFELELTAANKLGGDSEVREPFSVIFRGPLEPILPQAIYTLMHAEVGTMDLFLVPIGPDRENQGIQYEAIFS